MSAAFRFEPESVEPRFALGWLSSVWRWSCTTSMSLGGVPAVLKTGGSRTAQAG